MPNFASSASDRGATTDSASQHTCAAPQLLPTVKTRILILSDTCGGEFTDAAQPKLQGDVALNCGNRSRGCDLSEHEAALILPRQLPAPLKLVIPGANDITLDEGRYARMMAEEEQRDENYP